jgi:transcriptional regulator with XRE-family HTH domain
MTGPEYRIVANLIREVRLEAGLKQTELADRLAITQSVVSKYESGERRLDLLEIRRICSVCGVPLAAFIQRLETRLAREPNASG